ncbi:MAG: hypothetical protein ABI220_05490 [Candidatus Saccharimonadales bacterium]
MRVKTSLMTTLGLASSLVLLALVALALQPVTANAAAKSKDKPSTESSQKSDKETKDDSQVKSAGVYNYVAQPGDSYTKMARKATQTYGIDHKVNLQPAQIVFVETNLTQSVDSPLLNVGQKVTIQQQNVIDWIKKAQALTPSQIADWNYYVQFVDFNTNNVGESHKA